MLNISGYLNLPWGGKVKKMLIVKNTETYIFDVSTKDRVCKCCSSRDIKDDIKYITSFVDAPSEYSGRKRIVEAHYYWGICNKCKMTTINNLHLFDLRFNIIKRLIDYIYKNINKKSAVEVSEDTGLKLEVLYEIVNFNFNKAILDAHKNKRNSIWFDEDNQLINAS